MKIRIAIIEDEYFSRQAIRLYIRKLGDPYEVCGEAGNGQDGLELLRKERPDIALVDINMPVINGIDMMQRAFEEGIPTQMIILTGYSEFSYARTAVHLGVREYLLKPLRIEDLKMGLEHATKSIRKHSQILSDGKIDVEGLLSQQLAEQLTRSGADSADISLLPEHLGFPRDQGIYYVALIQFYAESSETAHILDQIATATKNMDQQDSFVISYPADVQTLCLIFNLPAETSCEELVRRLTALGNQILQQKNIQLKISLSSGCQKLSMIHDAYLEAQAVLQYYLFCDAQNIALYTPKNCVQSPSAFFDAKLRHNLMLLMRKGAAAPIKTFINDCFHRINRANVNADSVYLCVVEMLSVILEFDSFHSTNHDTGNESEGVLPALFAINHVDRLRKFVIQHAMKAIEHKSEDESVHAPLIRKVHDYIDANFSNSTLRLDDIARANFISTQYLCSIYRRATNATIGDYIFEVRMNHAQHLISIGQRNVTALSEACGYNDPDYFCKCFRKKFGMTPRQYIERQNS